MQNILTISLSTFAVTVAGTGIIGTETFSTALEIVVIYSLENKYIWINLYILYITFIEIILLQLKSRLTVSRFTLSKCACWSWSWAMLTSVFPSSLGIGDIYHFENIYIIHFVHIIFLSRIYIQLIVRNFILTVSLLSFSTESWGGGSTNSTGDLSDAVGFSKASRDWSIAEEHPGLTTVVSMTRSPYDIFILLSISIII